MSEITDQVRQTQSTFPEQPPALVEDCPLRSQPSRAEGSQQLGHPSTRTATGQNH